MFFVGCRFRVFDIICDGFRELGYVNVDFFLIFFWRYLLFCFISNNFLVVLVMLFVILL